MAGVSEHSAAATTHAHGQVARYRIVEQLGEGGMGVVHLARDEALGRNVALKLLAPRFADNVQFRERFVRESRLAAAIDHPNIIPVYEAGEAGGLLFIAMRYVRGIDLQRKLATDAPLAPATAVAIVDQVARALDAAHRAGLVHRDVKPGNVMLDLSEGGEHCYLMDFGLTKSMSSSSGYTETGQFLGTLNYMAPEQIEGRPLDARADLYALGCVLFECLSGRPPFRRDSEVAMMYAHLHEPPPSLCALRPELPSPVDTVLARAMAKAPADRHESCCAMVADLQAALGGAQLPSFRASAASAGRRFVRPPAALAPVPASRQPAASRPPAPAARPPAPPTAPPATRPIPPQLVNGAGSPSRPSDGPHGDRSYTRPAVIIALAILLCAGGIAAALVLRHGGTASTSAAQQARLRLLDRAVRLNTELANRTTQLQKSHGVAGPATKRQLATDRQQATALAADVRGQTTALGPSGPALTSATGKLEKAATGLVTYAKSHQPQVLANAAQQVRGASNDVHTASAQSTTSSSSSMPTVPMAALPMKRVALPGSALATVDAGAGRSIFSVGDAGDVNGDGTRDFGLLTNSSDGSQSAFVVYGGRGGRVQLGSIGDRGIEIPGATSIAPAGDVNKDGHDDVAVLATVGNAAEAAFVVFGGGDLSSVDLQNIGSGGREIDLPTTGESPVGPEDGVALSAVRAAGDVNHDGFGDVVVGDPLADKGAGRAWIVFGSKSTVPTSLDSIARSEGVTISGDAGTLGGWVSGADDVNGDGFADVIVGAPYSGGSATQQGPGAAYVIFGSQHPSDVDVSNLGGGGFAISTGETGAQLGAVVAGLGDVNGDHISDVLVTAPRSSPLGRKEAGSAYVVFGSRDGNRTNVSVDQLGTDGYAVQGPTPLKGPGNQSPSGLGSSAAAAGDVNGDGVPDFVLGSPGARSPGAIAYVVFGGSDAGAIDLADPGGRALAIDGPSTAQPGPIPVGGNADFDGDGKADVLVTPLGAGSSGPGKAYVVAGTP